MSTITELLGSRSKRDVTQEQIAKTTIAGPLAVVMSDALTEAYSVTPMLESGVAVDNNMVAESQQISAMQKNRLVNSLPKNLGGGGSSEHTTIYAVRRSDVSTADITEVYNRLTNVVVNPQDRYVDRPASVINRQMIVLIDATVPGEVTRKDVGQAEGLALAMESMVRAAGVKVATSLADAVMMAVRNK